MVYVHCRANEGPEKDRAAALYATAAPAAAAKPPVFQNFCFCALPLLAGPVVVYQRGMITTYWYVLPVHTRHQLGCELAVTGQNMRRTHP